MKSWCENGFSFYKFFNVRYGKCQKTLEKKITYHNDCHTIKCSFNIYVYLICYVFGWGMYKQLTLNLDVIKNDIVPNIVHC